MAGKRGLFSSGNPVMNEKAFEKASQNVLDSELVASGSKGEVMTVNGAINKTFILTALMMVTTIFSYANPSSMLLYVGLFGGLGVVLFASFKMEYSATLAPIYALLEGLFVGSISAMYAAAFDGIIFQAVSLTMAVLFLMLFLYKTKIIVVTQKLRAGVMMATGAIMVVYLLSWVLSFFGIQVPYLHENGLMGIGISLVIVGVASFNLLLDFDNFEKGAQFRSPKYMEWFCAMGLLITLVWLYVEMLRLLSKLSSD